MSGKTNGSGCTTKSDDIAKDLEAGVNDQSAYRCLRCVERGRNKDQDVVDFCGNDEPAYHLNWETIYKGSIVVLISTISAVT